MSIELPVKSVDEAIDLLNAAIKADPVAMHALFIARVECNEELGDHPTIQCGFRRRKQTAVPHGAELTTEQWDEKVLTVGLLGILNGIFGLRDSDWGYIVAVLNDDDMLIEFVRPRDSDDLSGG